MGAVKVVYLVTGTNGVIIHQDRAQADRCRHYLYGSSIVEIETPEQASDKAVAHLRSIAPPAVPVPDHVGLDDLVTVYRLMHPDRPRGRSKYPKKN